MSRLDILKRSARRAPFTYASDVAEVFDVDVSGGKGVDFDLSGLSGGDCAAVAWYRSGGAYLERRGAGLLDCELFGVLFDGEDRLSAGACGKVAGGHFVERFDSFGQHFVEYRRLQRRDIQALHAFVDGVDRTFVFAFLVGVLVRRK